MFKIQFNLILAESLTVLLNSLLCIQDILWNFNQIEANKFEKARQPPKRAWIASQSENGKVHSMEHYIECVTQIREKATAKEAEQDEAGPSKRRKKD